MIPVMPAARSSVISLAYCLAVPPMGGPLGWRKVELITAGAVVAASAAEDHASGVRVAAVSTPTAAMVATFGNLIGPRSAGPVVKPDLAPVQNGRGATAGGGPGRGPRRARPGRSRPPSRAGPAGVRGRRGPRSS